MRWAECEHCKSWVRYNASRFECARALSGFGCAFESRDGWEPKTYEDLEKENAELKKKSSRQSKNYKCDVGKLLEENAEWKQRNETLKDALEHARKVYGDDLEKSYKEIAELKEHHKSVCENLTNTHRNLREQLTKAKEIIKKIEKIFYSGEKAIKRLSKISDILAEAEQFLKDNEVEK